MGVAGIAAAVGAATAIASTSYAIASAPGMPGAPNLGAANAAAVNAQAQMLPWQRRYQAAAEQGKAINQAGFHQATVPQAQRDQVIATTQDQINKLKQALGGNAQRGPDWNVGNARLQDLQTALAGFQKDPSQPVYMDAEGGLRTKSAAVADFTGLGQGQVMGQVAKQEAADQLALQQKYDPQFIATALAQEQQADPQGYAARQELYKQIEQQANSTPDRPVANLLDQQVQQQLAAGKNLDPMEQAMLDQAVGQAQGARGQGGTSSDTFAQPMETGFEGTQRLQAAQQKANSWLSSGATPEDVAYRRSQQDLSNLGSFVNGQTPEAQFSNLSGAQTGAAPLAQNTPLPTANASAGQSGQQFALGSWQTQLGQAANQANPWMAGISTFLSGLGAAGKAGFKPLA